MAKHKCVALGFFHPEASGVIFAPTYNWWLWSHPAGDDSALMVTFSKWVPGILKDRNLGSDTPKTVWVTPVMPHFIFSPFWLVCCQHNLLPKTGENVLWCLCLLFGWLYTASYSSCFCQIQKNRWWLTCSACSLRMIGIIWPVEKHNR